MRPGGFWKAYAPGRETRRPSRSHPFVCWVLSVLTVLLLLQGIGRLVFLEGASGLAYLGGAGIAGFILWRLMRGMEW